MRLVKNKQLASAFRWVCRVALVEWESLVLNSGSFLGSKPTKTFGYSVEGWFALKRNLPLENKFRNSSE